MIKTIYVLLLLASGYAVQAQEAVEKVSRYYFRSDPFKTDFSDFLKHLLNDPTIQEKEMIPRTDSSLFFLRGLYSTHQPFFYKPAKLEVILAEIEMNYADSSAFKDTVLAYQLVAHSPASDESLKEVKKEFERIHRQLNKSFSGNNYQVHKNGEEIKAAWYNYFVTTHAVSPVTVAWGKNNRPDEVLLTITLRLKSSNNKAALPAPLLPGL